MGYCKRRCWLLGCQLWVAVFLSLAGVVLLFMGFWCSPTGKFGVGRIRRGVDVFRGVVRGGL